MWGKAGGLAGCWWSAMCCKKDFSRHLHSSETPEFCEGPETVGSASVNITAAVIELDDSEEEEEYNAAAAPA